MSTIITFNEYDPGTILTDQYFTQGILFDASDKTLVSNDSLLNNGNCVVRTNFRGPTEFRVHYVRAKFTEPRHTKVELSFGRLDPARSNYGDFIIYDVHGNQIKRQRFLPTPGRAWTFASLISTSANIASFEIISQSDSPGFFVDNIAFDSLSAPQQPDFVLDNISDIYINPGETIDVPVRVTRLFGSRGLINFEVVNLAPGLDLISIQPQLFVPGEVVHVRLRASEWTLSRPLVLKHPIFIVAKPAVATVGAVSRQIKVPTTIREPYDVQVVGVEITQGIQPHDLPQRRNVNSIEPVKYHGVKLAEDGRTVARIFLSYRQRPRIDHGHSFEVILHAKTLNNITLPGSPIHYNSMVRLFPADTGVVVTDIMRIKYGTHIEIPTNWCRGMLFLRAEVRPFLALGPQTTFETNTNNNVFELTDIFFSKTEVLRINAFHMRIQDPPNFQRFILPSPKLVFEETRAMAPFGINELLIPSDYSNVIDITDIYRRSDWSGDQRGARCNYRLRNAVDDWGFDDNERNFMVGVFSSDVNRDPATGRTSNTIRAQETTGLANPFWNLDFVRTAVVEAPRRPRTSVAHELGHMMGRKHASPADGAEDAEDWPPDNIGLIQGVGFDLRTEEVKFCARSATDSTHPRYIDFMSYGGDPGNFDPAYWVSPRGWNQAVDFLLLSGRRSIMSETISVFSTSMIDNFVSVQAVVDLQGTVEFLKIAPVARKALKLADEQSKFEFVLRDKGGVEIGRSKTYNMVHKFPEHRDAEASETFMMAHIPTTEGFSELQVIELVKDGQAIGKKERPDTSPVVRKPKLISSEGLHLWRLEWGFEYNSDQELEVKIEYLLERQPDETKDNWRNVFTGVHRPSASITTDIPETLMPCNPNAQFRIKVSDGFNLSQSLSDTFRWRGNWPSVSITNPVGGKKYHDGETMILHGEAYDDWQRQIDPDKMTWFIDGKVIGTGRSTSWEIPSPERKIRKRTLQVKLNVKDYKGFEQWKAVDVEVWDPSSLQEAIAIRSVELDFDFTGLGRLYS